MNIKEERYYSAIEFLEDSYATRTAKEATSYLKTLYDHSDSPSSKESRKMIKAKFGKEGVKRMTTKALGGHISGLTKQAKSTKDPILSKIRSSEVTRLKSMGRGLKSGEIKKLKL